MEQARGVERENAREREGAVWTSMIYCWKLVVVVVVARLAPATVGGHGGRRELL